MKIYKTGYEIVKSKDLEKLVIDRETYKTGNINLKHINEVLEKEKATLLVLLDQAEHTVQMLNQ